MFYTLDCNLRLPLQHLWVPCAVVPAVPLQHLDHELRPPLGRESRYTAQTHLLCLENACRVLQEYMHEFNVDKDHAVCNMLNCSNPVAQLTQLRKCSQQCHVLQNKVAGRQWRCLNEGVSFVGSCCRFLVFSPLPCQSLQKKSILVRGYDVRKLSFFKRCCIHMCHISSCNRVTL
jgi:hypothetical protein